MIYLVTVKFPNPQKSQRRLRVRDSSRDEHLVLEVRWPRFSSRVSEETACEN
jgi:hypothetical protein